MWSSFCKQTGIATTFGLWGAAVVDAEIATLCSSGKNDLSTEVRVASIRGAIS
jgi:hypothetical protein